MSDHDEAEFFRERTPLAVPRSALWLLGCLLFVALWHDLANTGSVMWLVAAASVGLCGAVLARFSQRRGWRVDTEGLHEVYRDGYQRHHRWTTVRRLSTSPHGTTVETEYGRLLLGPAIEGWQELVRRIEERTGLSGTPRSDPLRNVDPAQIAEWLGIPPGGALVGRPVRSWKLLLPAAAMALCLAASRAGWDILNPDSMTAGLVITLALAAPVCLWLYYRAGVGPRIRAHDTGLTFRTRWGRRDLGWADLLAVRRVAVRNQDRCYATTEAWQGDWDYVVETTVGEFRFHRSFTHAERLVDTMRRVLAAKEYGRLLPDAAGLPAAAISLVVGGSGSPSEERGLTRSDAPADGGSGA